MASLSFHKSLHRRTDSRAVAASAAKQPVMPLPSYSTPPTPTTPLAHVVDVFRPRKNRFRATAIALLSLVALSSYIVFFAGPSLSTAPLALRRQPPVDRPSAWQQFAMNYAAKYAGSAIDVSEERKHVVLDPAQELAALTAFMAALPQNVLPTAVDPAQPLDPQLILDFDTRSPGASDEVAEVVHDAWYRNPVVLFTKSRSSLSRELKQYIDALNLKPAQTVFDVDERGTWAEPVAGDWTNTDRSHRRRRRLDPDSLSVDRRHRAANFARWWPLRR